MTITDPFADAPETDVPTEDTVGSVKVAVKPVLSAGEIEGKVTVTLKGDGQPPWIVIHANSPADALSQFDNDLVELMTKAQKANKHFASIERPAPAASAQPASNGRPAGATQAPSWAPPMPDGYKYATGEKNGRVWHAYFPIDQRSGLEKIWLNPPRN